MLKYSRNFLYRIKRRRFFLLTILSFSLLLYLLKIQHYKSPAITYNDKIEFHLEMNDQWQNHYEDHLTLQQFTPELIYRPIYQSIYDDYQSIEEFTNKPLYEKCSIYFQKLHALNPDWWMSPKRGVEYPHDNNEKSENLIHLNIYNHCFMGKLESTDANIYKAVYKILNDLYGGNFDKRVYPYLTGKMPIFQHWNGFIYNGPVSTSASSSDIGNFDQLNEFSFDYDLEMLSNASSSSTSSSFSTEYAFWELYKQKLSGDGIAVSVNDELVDEAMSLIRNLRLLNNNLPIQFIHRGDLSTSNRYNLVKEARSNENNNNGENREYLEQDIWFVDLSFSISDSYESEFFKYFNKMLAYGFNSFKNMILMDTDIVLFQNPSEFFKSSQFESSKSLFFKDRNLDMHMSQAFIEFLQTTSPNKLDKSFFNIKPINFQKLDNSDYFKEKYFHYMESGVVVLDRSQYWNAVILSLQLSFIQSTLTGSWGDKEHFWIGCLLAGFDNYKFDKYWTASIGNVVDIVDGESVTHKICSAHPAHISSDNNELLWINSGILECPKVNELVTFNDFKTLEESEENEDRFQSQHELEMFYKSPISFQSFIIPPLSKYFHDADKNVGLQQLSLCDNYMWCSFDKIGNGLRQEWNGIYGIFTDEQMEKYNYIAKNYLKI